MKYSFIIFLLLFSLSLFSQEKELNLNKGKDEMAKKNYNLAIYYFDLAIIEDSLFIEAYQKRGLAKYNIGDYTGALNDYKYVLSKDPENANAYFGIASVKSTWKNDKYGAISDYTNSIEISLKKQDKEFAAVGYFLRGILKKELGDEKGYKDDMKKSAELGNESAIFNLQFMEDLKNMK